MTDDFYQKAKQEKYYNSIRYFSHSLKKSDQEDFIKRLSEENMYLAAQCIMSSRANNELEEYLKQKAEQIAVDFKNIDKSANAFLALAEFEDFERILGLLKKVQKPSRVHLKIFLKILSTNNPDIFFAFLRILVKLKNSQFIAYAISAFNFDLKIDSTNKDVIRSMISILFTSKLFGTVSIFFEKFGIISDFEYIMSENVSITIETLLKEEKITALKLAFKLVSAFDQLDEYPVMGFIKLATQNKNRKAISFALKMAKEGKVKNVPEIDALLEKIISPENGVPNKKNSNILHRLLKSDLNDYLSENNALKQRILEYVKVENKKRTQATTTTTVTENTKKEIGIIQNDQTEPAKFVLNVKSNLANFESLTEWQKLECVFDSFFSDETTFSIQDLIKYLLVNWATNLKIISHLLRKYEFEGNVRQVHEYGVYIECLSAKSTQLLFLHRAQISEINLAHPKDLLAIDDTLKFRIIGINKNTYRLNISLLSAFTPPIQEFQ